ncbi:MAG: XdhC family protein [Chloroflexi bacterium]|nr:XdhC family protein [Chloroflexota bacterium]
MVDPQETRAFLQALQKAVETGEPVALCMVIEAQGSVPRRAGSKMLVFADGRIVGTVGGGETERRVIQAAREALEDGQPRVETYRLVDPARGDPGVCGGQMRVYIEPILPPPQILIVGAGHVGKAVAELAHWLGFRVLVTDDRPDACSAEAFPEAEACVLADPKEIPQRISITPQTFVVLVTRGSPVDVEALPGLLQSPARYIGVIGSRRRWLTTAKALREQGVPEEALARVRTPIGLDIGAETPKEIALSILAEIVAELHGRRSKKPAGPRSPRARGSTEATA